MYCNVVWLRSVLRATTAYTFSTSEPPKMVRTPSVLDILTSKCASRHNGVHFFNIWTSKSGANMWCFAHFDLEMCFAPQRRALFQHLNFQKWSENGVFCTFWLGNVLRATTACTFSTAQLPKVVRTPSVLYILTWKCASRHNGVQIFIAPVASWLRTRRFSEPTFRPSGATNHWKNTVFRDFPTFSRICIFCPLTLSLLIFSLLIFLFSLPLPCSAFHLSILSEVWLLNFLRLFPLFAICHGYPLVICYIAIDNGHWNGEFYHEKNDGSFNSYVCKGLPEGTTTGWWLSHPSEKWWSSSVGMMTFPRYGTNKIHVPNHQPN